MTREQAIQIATNFYLHQEGQAPEGMMIKRMEPAGGRIIIWSDGYDRELDVEFKYEIEIDPVCGGITMKRILREYSINDFAHPATTFQKLCEGQQFRLTGNCVVYEYMGRIDDRSGCP